MQEPQLAALALCAGILLVCWEFCHPGQVLPGVAGAIAITLGSAALYRAGLPNWIWIAATGAPSLVAIAVLLRIALRARAAKRDWRQDWNQGV